MPWVGKMGEDIGGPPRKLSLVPTKNQRVTGGSGWTWSCYELYKRKGGKEDRRTTLRQSGDKKGLKEVSGRKKPTANHPAGRPEPAKRAWDRRHLGKRTGW